MFSGWLNLITHSLLHPKIFTVTCMLLLVTKSIVNLLLLFLCHIHMLQYCTRSSSILSPRSMQHFLFVTTFSHILQAPLVQQTWVSAIIIGCFQVKVWEWWIVVMVGASWGRTVHYGIQEEKVCNYYQTESTGRGGPLVLPSK